MSLKPYNLQGDQRLPPINGPKLWQFEHRKSSIKFLELLSAPPDEDEDEDEDDEMAGGHAHVFKVRIKSEEYALKVFKFFDIHQARENIWPFHNREVDDQTMTYQSDPFFAECRAFGRIDEIQKKRKARRKGMPVPDIAVPCYGFLILPPVPFEEKFKVEYNITRWNRRPEDLDTDLKNRPPFRAIVKKLIEDPNPIVGPKKMARDFVALQKAGVIQYDVFARNYKGGLLVDFSVAWTKPHWLMNMLSPTTFAKYKESDLSNFDSMIEQSGIKTTVRVSKARWRYARLRKLPSRWVVQSTIASTDTPSPSTSKTTTAISTATMTPTQNVEPAQRPTQRAPPRNNRRRTVARF